MEIVERLVAFLRQSRPNRNPVPPRFALCATLTPAAELVIPDKRLVDATPMAGLAGLNAVGEAAVFVRAAPEDNRRIQWYTMVQDGALTTGSTRAGLLTHGVLGRMSAQKQIKAAPRASLRG